MNWLREETLVKRWVLIVLWLSWVVLVGDAIRGLWS